MAFNYNAAIQAGYTPDEINQYLNKGQGNPQPQNNGGFLSGILNAARGFGLGAIQDVAAPLAMGAEELGQGYSPIAGIGKQAPLNVLQNDAKNNIFANQQQLQKMGGTFPQAATQVGQDTAGAASWMTPFGRGANIATKALLPGMTSGGLQALSQPNANPLTVGEGVVGGAILPTALAGAGKVLNGAGYVSNKLGQAADNTSNSLLRGQYNVSASDSRNLNLPEATQNIFNKYGISNKDTAVNVANQVTGKNGLYNKLVEQTVNQLPSTQLAGITQHAQEALNSIGTSIDDTRGAKILNNIKRNILVADDGTNIVDANPAKVLSSIKNLEGLARQTENIKNPTEQAQQEAQIYRQVAGEMENRLFNGWTDPDTNQIYPGANSLFIKSMKTPDVLNQAYAIHPQIGLDLEHNIHTLRDLRSAQAPFVSVSKAANQAEEAKMHSVGPSTMQAIGAGYLGQTIGWPGALAALLGKPVLNSNLTKSIGANAYNKIGGRLQKGANMGTSQMNPLLKSLILNASSKAPSAALNYANQP